jgi:hypothetical protein
MTSRSPVRDDAWECVYACVRVCVRIHPAPGLRARHMAAEGRRGPQRAACTVQLLSEGCEAVMYKPAGPRCSATVPLSRGGKWRAIIKGCVAPNVMSSLVFGLCLVPINCTSRQPPSLPPLDHSPYCWPALRLLPSLCLALFFLLNHRICIASRSTIQLHHFASRTAVPPHIPVACPPAAFACPPNRSTQQ